MKEEFISPDHIGHCPGHVTPEMVRECVLASPGRVGIIGQPDEMVEDFQKVIDACFSAIRNGRFFDFGELPNTIIESESIRAASLYAGGHIGHPFQEPWMFHHTWGEFTSTYLVIPLGNKAPGCRMIVQEFMPVLIKGERCLRLGPGANMETILGKKFIALGYPDPLVSDSELSQSEAISTTLNPTMVAMLILATEGVGTERIDPPEKLNKARAKTGKPMIPSRFRVHTEDYVTSFLSRRMPTRGPEEGRDGLNRRSSPIPHLRRGHIRALASGKQIWIRDALVNLRSPDAPLMRSFYQVANGRLKNAS